ncbi:MAG: copper chaperone PCu(A)C [Aliidongia sp.]
MGPRVFSRILSGILAVLFGMLVVGPATAASAGISVDGVWCRVSDYRARTGFVYMTVTIRGEQTDKLIGASTPVASATELIAPVQHKKREHLESVPEIELDAHAPTVLQPQGPHFLLRGLHHKLQPGESFIMTLDFAKAGKHDITVHVLKAAPADGMPALPKGVKLK